MRTLRKQKTPVSIFLVNGIRLHGQIDFFDNYVVAVRNTVTQLVYKHAISTIIPSTGEAHHSAPEKAAADAKPAVTVRTKPSRAAALKNR